MRELLIEPQDKIEALEKIIGEQRETIKNLIISMEKNNYYTSEIEILLSDVLRSDFRTHNEVAIKIQRHKRLFGVAT